MIEPIPAQANIITADLVARADGSPIEAGTINLYVIANTGDNAGNWFKTDGDSWEVAAAIAGIMAHKGDGHWQVSVDAACWIDGVEYTIYAKEGGDLHTPVSWTTVCHYRATITSAGKISGVALVDVCTENTDMRGTNNAFTAINGLMASGPIFRGLVTGIPNGGFVINTLSDFGTGAFTGTAPWYAFVFRDAGGAAAAPQGEIRKVTGYTTATGAFTTVAFTQLVAVGDDIMLINPALAFGTFNTAMPASPVADSPYDALDELQTDWANDGRLDVILDAAAKEASLGPLATSANQTTILNRLGAFTGTGVNTLLGFFKALFKKDAATPSDVGGTFVSSTDSLEAQADVSTEARLAELDQANLPTDVAGCSKHGDPTDGIKGSPGKTLQEVYDNQHGTDGAYTGTPPTPTEIIDEFETQSQADPTGFQVNVKEVNGTAQTANDNAADINTLLDRVTAAVATASALATAQTAIANIKAKTDNLPTSPADDDTVAKEASLAGLATASALATAQGNLTSILEDTGATIPALIAALNDPTATAIATAVLEKVLATHEGVAGSLAEAMSFVYQHDAGSLLLGALGIMTKKKIGGAALATWENTDGEGAKTHTGVVSSERQ